MEGQKLFGCYDVLFTDETLLTNFLKLLKAVCDNDGIMSFVCACDNVLVTKVKFSAVQHL